MVRTALVEAMFLLVLQEAAKPLLSRAYVCVMDAAALPLEVDE